MKLQSDFFSWISDRQSMKNKKKRKKAVPAPGR
jgi:hypothetical protein